MRVGTRLIFASFVAGCTNTLHYAPPGGGTLSCADSGAICSVGYAGVGDGGPAIEASLVNPGAIARNAAGDLFLADRSQNRIRRIDAATGLISTVVGTGEESYALTPGLSGGETVAASPLALAVTDDGTLFWADERACTIYALGATSGTVSLAAGSRCQSYGGGNLPVDVLFDFNGCSRIRANGNDLLIASSDHGELRYWNRGSSPRTIAGISVPPGEVRSVAGLLNPCDAAVASDGTLFTIEADYADCRIRRITSAGTTSFLVGTGAGSSSPCGNAGDGGPSTAAQINYPQGIVLDEARSLLFVSDESARIRAINLDVGNPGQFAAVSLGTGHIATIAGTGATSWLLADQDSALNLPFGSAPRSPVLDDDGSLIVADPSNGVIRRIDAADGTMSIVAGLADGGTLENYMTAPATLARSPGGDMLVAARSARVWRISSGGRSTFAGTGVAAWSGDGGPATQAGVWASGLAVAPDGRVFIADARNHRVRVVDPGSGTISTIAGNDGSTSNGDGGLAVNASFAGPSSVLVDSAGNLVLSDVTRIRYVNLGLSSITVAGVTVAPQNIATIAGGVQGYGGDGGPATAARLNLNEGTEWANGLAIAGRTLYVADTLNNRIRKIDLDTGVIGTVVGAGAGGADAVGRPVGIAVHDGHLYWTQLDGNLVKRMPLPSGAIEVLAGDGNTGYYGEGVHASLSQLVAPQGLAIEDDGAILVTDGSHRVRRIRP